MNKTETTKAYLSETLNGRTSVDNQERIWLLGVITLVSELASWKLGHGIREGFVLGGIAAGGFFHQAIYYFEHVRKEENSRNVQQDPYKIDPSFLK